MFYLYFLSGDPLWTSNCNLNKNYKHKIVRRMRMGKFNEPSHSDITSTCEIFKSSDATNFGTISLTLFCLHMHFLLLNCQHLTSSIYFSQSLCAFNSCSQTFLLLVCRILKCSFSNLYYYSRDSNCNNVIKTHF